MGGFHLMGLDQIWIEMGGRVWWEWGGFGFLCFCRGADCVRQGGKRLGERDGEEERWEINWEWYE